MKDTYILGIESSCDETAAAVVKNGREVLSNVISSQIDTHTKYGGVVPEIASRKHVENINAVVRQALLEAGFDPAQVACQQSISKRSLPKCFETDSDQLLAGEDSLVSDVNSAQVSLQSSEQNISDTTVLRGTTAEKPALDAISVTYGPGLVGALLVGVAEAKALAHAWNLPLVGVHHITGHVSANFLEHPDLEPPFMCLIVSGGHTNLVIVKDYGVYEIIGTTRDDAAGEAYDKVARSVGLGYPGGPKIDKEAKNGNPDAIIFPKAKVDGAPYDFSFSGLKSAVLNYQNHAQMMGEEINRADLVASFQKAVVDVLVEHTIAAANEYGFDRIAMAGGVASNSALRAAMDIACRKHKKTLYYPSPIYCTDNAAMIASAGYYEYLKGRRDGLNLNAVPNLKL